MLREAGLPGSEVNSQYFGNPPWRERAVRSFFTIINWEVISAKGTVSQFIWEDAHFTFPLGPRWYEVNS